MKKVLLVLLSILLVCVGAYADLTVTDVTVGSATQTRNEVASATFTVTNTGTTDVTVSAVTSSANAKYEVVFEPTTPFTLTATGTTGASKTVTVTATVPEDFNAVNTDLEAVAFELGTITVTGNDGTADVTGTAKLHMQAENKLTLRKGKAIITGVAGSTTDSFREGDTIKDLKPGDRVDLEVQVENNFPSRGDRATDFDDVEVTIELSDETDFDLDDDSDDFSLGSNDDDMAKLSFDIENDARDKKSTMTLRAEALDENGARHGAVMTVTLDVSRDAHDLVLSRASLSPSRLVCDASRTVTFTGEVLNRGRLDEDEAVVELRVNSLGILEKTSDLEVNEDETEDVKLTFKVPADAVGTFDVDVLTNYDLTKSNNAKVLTLTVDECKEEVKLPAPVVQTPEPKVEDKTPVVQVPPGVVTQPGQTVTQAVPPARVSSAFREGNNYLLLLGVACAVILVLIVALLAATVKRR